MRGIGIEGAAILVLSALASFGNVSICLFSLPRKRSFAFAIISSLVLFIVVVIIIITIPLSSIFVYYNKSKIPITGDGRLTWD